jgi:hypothetical protein
MGFEGDPLFAETAWGGFSFGFLVSRHLQIDFGFEASAPVVGPYRGYDPRYVDDSFGVLVVRDPAQPIEERVSDGPVFLAPAGVRIVVGSLSGRLVLGLGAGAAFLLHGEASDRDLTLPDGTTIRGCARSCENRYGLGAYGLGRLDYFVSAQRRVGFGLTARYTVVRARSGLYLPRFTDAGVRDRWLQLGGALSVRF